MGYVLSQRSLARLDGVHPDLVRVVQRAIQITDIDFVVTEGVRTLAKQKEMVATGASKTMNSRHLKAANGYSHAVDLASLVGGVVVWDWPLYAKLAKAMKQAAMRPAKVAASSSASNCFGNCLSLSAWRLSAKVQPPMPILVSLRQPG